MIVRRLHGPPPPELALALAEFEAQFTYPLGPGRTFRISRGSDYPRFFRAIGQGASFVAEAEGRVLGALGMAVRPLALPDGSERLVAYLGDLKIAPAARGGWALVSLARSALAWAGPHVEAAFSVVMDGTPVTPVRYTGRAGLPAFRELGNVIVFRIATGDVPLEPAADHWVTTAAAGMECYRRLRAGRYACPGGQPAERSEIAPLALLDPEGSACGQLEDTRKAKRLLADDGSELLSAHLSSFAFRTSAAGAELLRVARSHAAERGFPALFVAVAAPEAEALREALGPIEMVAAPATVYGTGLPAGAWNINTSEI
jgi:hypothetical protein